MPLHRPPPPRVAPATDRPPPRSPRHSERVRPAREHRPRRLRRVHARCVAPLFFLSFGTRLPARRSRRPVPTHGPNAEARSRRLPRTPGNRRRRFVAVRARPRRRAAFVGEPRVARRRHGGDRQPVHPTRRLARSEGAARHAPARRGVIGRSPPRGPGGCRRGRRPGQARPAAPTIDESDFPYLLKLDL